MVLPKHRVLSVKSGNPITIQDEDIGTTWPAALVSGISIPFKRPLLTFYQDGSTSNPWPSIVLTWYTQLSRILGRIGEGWHSSLFLYKLLQFSDATSQRFIERSLDPAPI